MNGMIFRSFRKRNSSPEEHKYRLFRVFLFLKERTLCFKSKFVKELRQRAEKVLEMNNHWQDFFILLYRYHRLFLHGFKLVTFYRDCAHFWKQLVKGEQHKVNDPEASDNKLEQTTAATLTPGTIEFRQSRTLGGHVACVLSLLATNKVRMY